MGIQNEPIACMPHERRRASSPTAKPQCDLATYRARETANLYLDEATSNLYAKAFDVPSEWLIFGTGPGLPTAVLYGSAFAVEADWLLSGRLPSGLPAEAQASLNALLAMHYKSDGEALSAFRHLVRQERPAFTKEDRPGGEAPTSPEPIRRRQSS